MFYIFNIEIHDKHIMIVYFDAEWMILSKQWSREELNQFSLYFFTSQAPPRRHRHQLFFLKNPALFGVYRYLYSGKQVYLVLNISVPR